MLRRMVLKIIGLFILGIVGAFLFESPIRDKIIGRIKLKLNPLPKMPSEREKRIAILPSEGANISVETALNSRCNSDYNGNQKFVHWGLFDRDTKLSDDQIKTVVSYAKMPRFTDRKVEIKRDKNLFTFIVENLPQGTLRDWIMIESGMQQQAVGLVCAALGIGVVFRNLGMNGREISDQKFGTVKNMLAPMKPSYNGSYWSSNPPEDRKPWKNGNLPDPMREGKKALISTLSKLETSNIGNKRTTGKEIGQILWAARGRTPHLYKSKPWGMTVPFWTDKFEVTSVYLKKDDTLYKYVNWKTGRPTHSILQMEKGAKPIRQSLKDILFSPKAYIIFGLNDDNLRAFWETGYQLLNTMIQAHALDISFKAILFDEAQRNYLRNENIKKPVALLVI